MGPLFTIGYEGATVPALLETLRDAKVGLLVDIRAVANSRRPGFAKTALAANAATIDVDYLHLRGLGTPADGRAAARGGKHVEMRRIFLSHLSTDAAQSELETVANLLRSGRRVCLLCFEADATHCHRSLVADALVAKLKVDVVHLSPQAAVDDA